MLAEYSAMSKSYRGERCGPDGVGRTEPGRGPKSRSGRSPGRSRCRKPLSAPITSPGRNCAPKCAPNRAPSCRPVLREQAVAKNEVKVGQLGRRGGRRQAQGWIQSLRKGRGVVPRAAWGNGWGAGEKIVDKMQEKEEEEVGLRVRVRGCFGQRHTTYLEAISRPVNELIATYFATFLDRSRGRSPKQWRCPAPWGSTYILVEDTQRAEVLGERRPAVPRRRSVTPVAARTGPDGSDCCTRHGGKTNCGQTKNAPPRWLTRRPWTSSLLLRVQPRPAQVARAERVRRVVKADVSVLEACQLVEPGRALCSEHVDDGARQVVRVVTRENV